MIVPKKVAALAAGFLALLSAASLAQNPTPSGRTPAGAGDVLVLQEPATLEWIQKADVAALREGVIEKMELEIGAEVQKGGLIGKLNDRMAELAVAKAKIAAKNVGAILKAEAQRNLAMSVLARSQNLLKRGIDYVSKEEVAKNVAELEVADAMKTEAVEQVELNKAELAIAERTFEEHKITSPFDGVIYELMKHPGESVRANEAVVRLGNLNKLRAWAYVPLEYASRVKEGQRVELQLRLQGARGEKQPIEQKRFVGKITFVDPQIQPVAETAVRVYADFENPTHELRPGFRSTMTIFLTGEGAAAAPAPAVGARIGVDR
ncbi:MAG: efflux RND transporter periplasmic adaptor subunit [Isosphaeraceae bacterium]|nr:efflux RND transporter periplasmic adaptor subunit [Isosphaeraceae bacterium]